MVSEEYYDRRLGRFLEICLKMAEINDRQAEENDRGDSDFNKTLGLGYLAFSGYMRDGVMRVISLQDTVTHLREKTRIAESSEESARDYLEEVFGDREPENINDKDKERIKAFVQSIFAEWDARIEEDVSEIEDMMSQEELAKQKKRDYQREYERKKRARKKAEAEEAPDPLEVVDPEDLPEEPDTEETETDNDENNELIKKAVQYFSADLAEAIYEQRLRIEEEKSKLRKMEDDLERCKRILGFGKEGEG